MNRLLLGIAWIALGAMGLLVFQTAVRLRRRIMMRWGRSKAAVVRGEVILNRLGLARPLIVYEYDAGHHHFLGQVRPWGWWWGSSRQAAVSLERYPPGTMFTVIVDPDNHQRTLLRPWPSVSFCGVLGALASAALVLGTYLVMSSLRG